MNFYNGFHLLAVSLIRFRALRNNVLLYSGMLIPLLLAGCTYVPGGAFTQSRYNDDIYSMLVTGTTFSSKRKYDKRLNKEIESFMRQSPYDGYYILKSEKTGIGIFDYEVLFTTGENVQDPALEKAIRNDDRDLAQQIREDKYYVKKALLYGDKLIPACKEGNMEVVKKAIQHHSDLDQMDRSGETALTTAAKFGQNEIAEFLIENGVDVNQTAKDGTTALIWASSKGNLQLVRHLLEEGADVNQASVHVDGMTGGGSLGTAVSSITRSGVRRPYDKTMESVSLSPLFTAASWGYTDIVKILIESGADVNFQTSKYERTPLMVAARFGYEDIVRLLLQNNADVRYVDADGKTALQLTPGKHKSIRQWLKEAEKI